MINTSSKCISTCFVSVIAFFLFSCSASHPDSGSALIITNAYVWTGDSANPRAESVAIEGDRIVFVGTNEEVKRLFGGSARIIDAKGKMVVPGFNDSHIHFLDGGFGLSSVKLRDAQTPDEFIKRISLFTKTVPAGTWIIAGDWDHTLWGGELPAAAWIDSVTKDHPVFIQRLDGHMGLANTLAMKISGISKSTKDVGGGAIVRYANGDPTGIFKDNAMSLVSRHITEFSNELKDKALEAAMNYVAENGVTSVQNMGTWAELEVFRRAHKNRRLITRIYAVVPLHSWQKLAREVETRGRGDEYLKIGGLKEQSDGSLGSHTAAFKDAYTDTPADSGFMVTPVDELFRDIKAADKAGLQVMIHAIGDKAIHEQLNIFERVAAENGERDRRFRIEHAQHIAAGDLPRFSALKVIGSMQPYHAIDDGRWAEEVIGPERIKTTYAFRSLLSNGSTLAFGSDWFVAPATPLEGIYAAVTRRTLDGKNPAGWVPEQKISIDEALAAYTTGSAYASHEENIKGMLKKGYLADLVLLDRNLFTILPEKIREAKVLMTIVGGKIVYENPE